ncbi:prolyl oligopeptidase family serine peptidase [Leptobacterium sp. I13]|uniref:prolyl oligopeptidase family serine peptidase n=1 Tax=Leptobacterium meishanense TaxID=3128904 RepID=UPI0030EB7914
MKSNYSLLFLAILGIACNQEYKQKINYPESKQITHYDSYHGDEVADPYQWLEAMDSPETKKWVEEQDKLLQEYLEGPIRNKIKNQLKKYVDYDSYSNPIKRGESYYFTKVSVGASEPKIYVQKGAEPEELLLDPKFDNEDVRIANRGANPVLTMSMDGQWLTYNVSEGEQRWYELRTYNIANRSNGEIVKGLHQIGGSPVWKKSEGFYYSKFKTPENKETLSNPTGNAAIYYHKIGTEQSEDVLTLPSNFIGEDWLYTPKVSREGNYLIIEAREGSKVTNRIYYTKIDNTTSITPLFIEDNANYLFLGNTGNHFFFYTDLNAPNGRVIGVDITKKENNGIYEIIPESKEAIGAGSLTGGNAIGFFADKFVVKYTKDGEPLIKVFDIKGEYLYSPILPVGGSVWGGFTGEQDDTEVFYNFLGLIDPSSIYKLDLGSEKVAVFKRSLKSLKAEDYAVEKVLYTSKDGARVPMFITYKKGLKKDGSNPGFIYGYGALGWVSFIWFQEHVITWLEMGGVYAQPGIRGGGEYGLEWHEAGKKQHRQNAIDDYVMASKWLIENKYVHPKKLVANGGSISASLVGAAINQNPELYGASVIDRPAMDMLRYPKFTGANHWIQELGSPDIEEEYEILKSYSPYHNIKEGTCYPPMLIMIGDEDDTTPPLHAYKYTAALQTNSTCEENPILLKMMYGAAHTFGTTKEQRLDSRTDELTFLVKVLGIDLSVD